jgi:hypothetical protein
MDTVFDYLKWRGDLLFDSVACNEVDSMMLSMSVYVDLERLCEGGEMRFADAAEGYCADGKYDSENLGLIMPSRNINKMFCEMAKTRRFANVIISDHISKTCSDEGYQFSATVFRLSRDSIAVVFRGTDDSITGWREDCCLSYLEEIPSQRMAIEYLESMAEKYPEKKIVTIGHSKGGNLALYGSIMCRADVRERISHVYSLDAPGLTRRVIDSDEYASIEKRVTVVMPQSSFVGTMFERGERYSVVMSKVGGLLQHDPFTWTLRGPRFLKFKTLSGKGRRNEEQFRRSMENMTSEEKRHLVEGFFGIIESTGAKTLTELTRLGPKRMAALIKTYGDIDKEQREMLTLLFFKLFELKK